MKNLVRDSVEALSWNNANLRYLIKKCFARDFSIGSAASGFDNSFYMGSPQIGASSGHGPGNLFRSFPRPHSSPKMKLRLTYSPCLVIAWLIFLFLSYQAYLHVFVFAAQNSNAK